MRFSSHGAPSLRRLSDYILSPVYNLPFHLPQFFSPLFTAARPIGRCVPRISNADCQPVGPFWVTEGSCYCVVGDLYLSSLYLSDRSPPSWFCLCPLG